MDTIVFTIAMVILCGACALAWFYLEPCLERMSNRHEAQARRKNPADYQRREAERRRREQENSEEDKRRKQSAKAQPPEVRHTLGIIRKIAKCLEGILVIGIITIPLAIQLFMRTIPLPNLRWGMLYFIGIDLGLFAFCLYTEAKVEGNWHRRYQEVQVAGQRVQPPPSVAREDKMEQKGDDTVQRDERADNADTRPANGEAAGMTASNMQPARQSGPQKEKPVHSATDIASQVMRGQGAGLVEGIAALYQMKREAGMEEKMLEQVERKMSVRQRLAHGVAKTITAEDGVPEALHRAQMSAIRRERELEEARNPPPPVPERQTWTPPPPRPAWMPNSDSDLKRVAREVCIEICKEQDPQAAWENFCYDINKHEMPPRLREELEDLVRERLQALDVL